MGLIRSSGNQSTEVRLARLFRAARISGWRRHYKLHGQPDFVFPKRRLAIFVDGCFWHGCPQHQHLPKSNVAYWAKKIAGNCTRDKKARIELREKGWRVLRIWEHELKSKQLTTTLRKLKRVLEH